MPIKSFRGQITDGSIDVLPLSTNNGSTGYRIKNFKIISKSPGVGSEEDIVKIYSIPQTTTDADIDFSDNTLLAAGFAGTNAGAWYASDSIVFDNMTFNQDIYVTFKKQAGTKPTNYYIELEQVKLSLDENTVATLKDIRNIVGQ